VPVLAPGTDLASLSAREQAQASRINELETRLAVIDTDSRAASAYAGRAEGLMVAFAARRAIDRGLPLGHIEGQLRQRFEATEPGAVAVIIRAAADPVTREDLRLALDAIAPTLVSGGSSGSWWRGFKREVSSLVVLRKDTTPSPQPNDRLTRARRAIDGGNVEAALGEVARLPGANDAPSWQAAAKRYLETRRALDSIELAALQGRSGLSAAR
jgi:hypothetical protein